jgi:hypothetical protein
VGTTEATIRRLALSLPEAGEAPHHEMTSFRVGGKIFATVTPDRAWVHIFLGSDAVAAYRAEYPELVEELWWGRRLSGCRVMLTDAPSALLRELLTEAWRRRAPKRLLTRFDESRP